VPEPPAVPEPGSAGAPVSLPQSHNLALRVVSAAVLAPIAVFIAWLGDWPFALFWGAAAVAVLWEWTRLVAGPRHWLMLSSCASAIAVAAMVAWRGRPLTAIMLVGLGALAATIFAPRGKHFWITAGIGYAGTMLLAPMLLRADARYGLFAILLLFAVVWTTDVFAYFAGRAIGGPKLAPGISPKKTWVGAIAGTLGAILAAEVMAGFADSLVAGPTDPFDRGTIAIVALLLSVLAQLGDLLESWIKRRFGAKDASALIPGHGGVMDRLDGFWAAALAGCVVGLLRGGFDNAARGLLVW
jgi:phosphatidate cytidylyltransferase